MTNTKIIVTEKKLSYNNFFVSYKKCITVKVKLNLLK